MKTIAFILLICFPVKTFAQATGMQHIPPWALVGTRACYEFSDAKKLVQIDMELSDALSRVVIYKVAVAELHKTIEELGVASHEQDEAMAIMVKNRDALAVSLLSETTRANKAEANTGIGFGWYIGIGAGLLLIGLVGGLYLAKK